MCLDLSSDKKFSAGGNLRFNEPDSVPSNIAEGYGRLSRNEYKHFLAIAQGSNLELQTQLVIASELDFGDKAAISQAEGSSFEVGKMLTAMLKQL